VKRLLLLLGLIGTVALTFGGCGVEEEGLSTGDAGLGGAGTGGTGVGGGTCFPGSKVCDVGSGPVCNPADVPEFGCSGTTQCDPCNLPNAKATCGNGLCVIESCLGDYQDCDGNPTNGCESNKFTDSNNCGSCGKDCQAPPNNKGWICNGDTTNPACEVNECCPTGDPSCVTKAECDGDKSTCEDTAGDPNHCGFCNNKCNLAHAQSACSQSMCVVTQCDTGYANCDGNDANGCETNISNDVGNCGTCGKVCNTTNGGAQCVNGNCQIQCSAGFGNCDNNVDNGCETNTTNNPLHCNGCGKKCNSTNGTATCGNSQCGINCNSGFGNCDNNVANGCETNTTTNANHCGGCGNKCPTPSGGTAFCSTSTCGDNCGALTVCSGNPSYCADTTKDVNNCNTCGNICPNNVANSAPTCVNKVCGFNCNSGYNKCGAGSTTCYDVGSDPTHCGSNCINCPGAASGTSDPTCASGTCGFNCKTPTPNKCGNNCVNLQSDKNNCKVCGTKCTDPANGVNNCVAGTCTITCNGTLTECGGSCVDTQTDESNCGGCGTTCGANQLCCGGNCKDKLSDNNNCGNCGVTCTSTQDCCTGACVDTDSDPNKCGSCTNKCGSTEICSGGTCSCPPAKPDTCNSTCVDKQTDPNNCGSCGTTCGSGATCSGGTCTCSTGNWCDGTNGLKGCFACCGPNGQKAECAGGEQCCNGSCIPNAQTCP